MPWIDPEAPISAPQSRPMAKLSVAAKAAVATAMAKPDQTASRVEPSIRPRFATHSPAIRDPMPMQAVSTASESAPRPKLRSTKGGRISCTPRISRAAKAA